MSKRWITLLKPVTPILHRFCSDPPVTPIYGEIDIPPGVYEISGPYNLYYGLMGWEINNFDDFLASNYFRISPHFFHFYNNGYCFHILTTVVEEIDRELEVI